jgi:hypothetical protein
MSRDERIIPLIDSESGASQRVRSAIVAARDDVPSRDHVEAMLARLPIGGPDGAPDGGPAGADGIGAAAGGAALLKLGAAAAITLTAGAAYLGLRARDRSPPPPAPVASESTRPGPPLPRTAVAPAPAPVPEAPSASSPPRAVAPLQAAPSGSAPAPVARTEIEILREAQAARGSNPSRALALVDEHARAHPRGRLAQERDLIRIEATLALGRRAEASALAQQFRARYPGSAYAQRLDDLLGPP